MTETEKLTYVIDFKSNIESTIEDAKQQREQFSEMKKETQVDGAENLTAMQGANIETATTTLDTYIAKLEKLKSTNSSISFNQAEQITEGLKDLKVEQLFRSGNGGFDNFGVQFAKSMFSGFTSQAIRELDSEIPKVVKALQKQSITSALRSFAEDMTSEWDIDEVFNGSKTQSKLNTSQRRDMIQALTAAKKLYQTREYADKRFNATETARTQLTPETVLPKSYRDSYKGGGYQQWRPSSVGKKTAGSLNEEARAEQRDLIESNGAAYRAARRAGLIDIDQKTGRYETTGHVTVDRIDRMRRNLFNDLERRSSGRDSSKINFYKPGYDGSDIPIPEGERRRQERTLTSRMMTGTSGTVLRAMDRLEEIIAPDRWGRAANKQLPRPLEIRSLPKYNLEQYEIDKFHFGDPSKRKRIMIGESQATDMLGLQGHHNQYTDKVVSIDFSDYDRKNPEHRAAVERLLSRKGTTLPGFGDKRYIAQSMHGTEWRFIPMEEYKKGEDKEFQKRYNLTGSNAWDQFTDTSINMTSEELARYNDARSKMWTDTHRVEGVSQNPRIAVVNLRAGNDKNGAKVADGQAWINGKWVPYGGIQSRMALSGKGVTAAIKEDTMGEWARNNGFADEQGRIMMMGADKNGTMFDVSGYNGIIDASQVKGQKAFANLQTPEEISEAYSAQYAKFPIRGKSSLAEAHSKARSIGSQAMQGVEIPADMIRDQANAMAKRINYLRSMPGRRELIFGGGNEALANRIRNKEILLSDDVVTNTVDDYINSMLRETAQGAWYDMSEEGKPLIENEMLHKTLTASMQQYRNLKPDEIRKQLIQSVGSSGIGARTKEKLLKRLSDSSDKNYYTNDILEGIFATKDNYGVNFARIGEDNFTAIRSPTGPGEVARIQNFAKWAKPIYEALGYETNGVYLSEEIADRMGDADWDGDKVKAVYGKIGEVVAASHERMRKGIKEYDEEKQKQMLQIEKGSTEANKSFESAKDQVEEIEKAQDAQMAMSSGDALMSKGAAQGYNALMIQALGKIYYNESTNLRKGGGSINPTSNVIGMMSDYGRPWRRLNAYSSVVDTRGLRDEDIVKSGDYKFNKDELKNMQLNRIELASRFNDSTGVALALSALLGGETANTAEADAMIEAFHKIEGNERETGMEDADAFNDALMRIKLYQGIGAQGRLTVQESNALFEMEKKAKRAIDRKISGMQLNKNGKYEYPQNGETKEYNRANLRTFLRKKYGIDIFNHQREFGHQPLDVDPYKRSGIEELDQEIGDLSLLGIDENEIIKQQIEQNVANNRSQAVSAAVDKLTQIALNDSTVNSAGLSVTGIEPWMTGNKKQQLERQKTAILHSVEEFRSLPNTSTAAGNLIHAAMEYSFKNNKSPGSTLGKMLRGDFSFFGGEEQERLANELAILENAGIIKDNGAVNENSVLKEAAKLKAATGRGSTQNSFMKQAKKENASFISEYEGQFITPEIQKILNEYGVDASKGSHRPGGIRPDLIGFDKNGNMTMYDYKSSMYGAEQSIQQMATYTGLMNEMSKRFYALQNGTAAENFEGELAGLKEAGAEKWGRLDDKGNFVSNIKKLVGFDASTGQRVIRDISDEAGQKYVNNAVDLYTKGIRTRLEAAKTGDIEARKAAEEEIYRLYGDNPEVRAEIRRANIEEGAQRIRETAAANDGNVEISPLLAQKLTAQKESYDNINAALNKKDFQMRNLPEGGYSQFNSLRRQLSESSLSDSDLTQLKAKYGNDTLEGQLIESLISQRESIESHIDETERAAIPEDIKYASNRIRQIQNGTQGMQSIGTIKSLERYFNDARAEVEGLKQSKYLDENGQWKTDDESVKQHELYDESLKQVEELGRQMQAARKSVIERDAKNSQRSLDKLLKNPQDETPESKLEEYYDKRREAIEQQINQYEENISELTKEIETATKQGDKRKAEDLQSAKANAESLRKRAQDYLASGKEEENKQAGLNNIALQKDINLYRTKNALRNVIADSVFIDKSQESYQRRHEQERLRNSPFFGNTMFERNLMNRMQQSATNKDNQTNLERTIVTLQSRIREETARQAQLNTELKPDGSNAEDIQAKLAVSEKSIRNWNKEIVNAQTNLDQLRNEDMGSFGQAMAAGFDTATQAVNRLVQRLGRQVLYKAFNEAKQFAIQFSTQMSQIQAITMMSDEEMQGERAKNISQAQSLHTSISNVAETRAALYRQGLSDSEVDSRTEAIIKFATVTGTKVTNATKYLTSAIQNGLVDSVESAMDVLVALGDSAATTAEEISKGMQKSAAAAANAGVSFEELSAMLTITTSRTQLGGNVAGTAMQTLLSRMTRVTNGQALIDSSGDVISANKVEEVLKSIGINMRSSTNPSSFRGAYDILLDLSKVWNNLSDIQKGNVSYAMAGGRQVNMFQTQMEGFAEDGGTELERLMELTENAEGITDDKYALAINNINTALTDLKNTFDGFVESLTSNGTITGAIDFLSNVVSGIQSVTNVISPLGAIIQTVAAAFGVLAGKMALAAVAKETLTGGLAAGVGAVAIMLPLLAAGATAIGLNAIGGASTSDEKQKKLSKEQRQDRIDDINDQIKIQDKYLNSISSAKETLSDWRSGSIDETDAIDKLNDSLGELAKTSTDLQGAFDNPNIDAFGSALELIETKSEAAKQKLIELKQEIIDIDLKDEMATAADDIKEINENMQLGTLAQPNSVTSSYQITTLKNTLLNRYNIMKKGMEDNNVVASNLLWDVQLNSSADGYTTEDANAIWKEFAEYYKNASNNNINLDEYESFEQALKEPEFQSYLEWYKEHPVTKQRPQESNYIGEDVIGTRPSANEIPVPQKRVVNREAVEEDKIVTQDGFIKYLENNASYQRTNGIRFNPSDLSGYKEGMPLREFINDNAPYLLDAFDSYDYFTYSSAVNRNGDNFNAEEAAAEKEYQTALAEYERKIAEIEAEQEAWDERYKQGYNNYLKDNESYEALLADNEAQYNAEKSAVEQEFTNRVEAIKAAFPSWLAQLEPMTIKDLYNQSTGTSIEKLGGIVQNLKFTGDESYDAFMKGFRSFKKLNQQNYPEQIGLDLEADDWVSNAQNLEDEAANQLNALIEKYFTEDYDSEIADNIYKKQLEKKAREVSEQFVKERYFNLMQGEQNQLIEELQKDIVANPTKYSDKDTIVDTMRTYADSIIAEGIEVSPGNEPYYYLDEKGNVVGVSSETYDKWMKNEDTEEFNKVKGKLMYHGTKTKLFPTFGEQAAQAYDAIEQASKSIQPETWRELNRRIQSANDIAEFSGKIADTEGFNNLPSMMSADKNLAVLYNQAVNGGQNEWAVLQNYITSQTNGGNADEVIGKALSARTNLQIDKGILDRIQSGKLTTADMAKIASTYGASMSDYLAYQDMFNGMYAEGVNRQVAENNQALIDYAKNNEFFSETGGWNENVKNKRMLQYLRSQLEDVYEEMEDDIGLTNGRWHLEPTDQSSKTSASSFAATEDMFMNYQLNRAASTAFGTGDWASADASIRAQYGANADAYIEQIKNKYPELYKWLNMDSAQRTSEEGQTLERNIRINFQLEGLQQMEQAGKLIEGMSENIAGMQSESASRRERAKYSATGLVSGFNDATQAMDRIMSRSASAEDWTTVGNYLGLDTTTLALYQSGAQNKNDLRMSLNSMRSQAEQGVAEMMKARVVQAYNQQYGTNITDWKDMPDYFQEEGDLVYNEYFDWAKYAQTHGYMDDYNKLGYYLTREGEVKYNAGLAAQTSAYDRYAAARNIRAATNDNVNYNRDYGLMYSWVQDYANAGKTISAGQLIQRLEKQNPALANLLSTDQEFIQAQEQFEKGDKNAIARFAYNRAYGGGYGAGMYNINSDEVQSILSTLLSGGNVNDLLVNKPELSSYMSNLLPNQEEYKNVLAQNKELTEAQKNDIKQIEATQKAVEKERTGEYQAGTSSNISTLYGVDEQARKQVIQSYASEYYQMTQMENTLASYKSNRDNRDARSRLAQYLGINEQKLAGMSNQELDNEFNKQENLIKDKFKDFIKGAFDIADFSDFTDLEDQIAAIDTDGTKMALYEAIKSIFDMAGIAIENGKASAIEEFNAADYAAQQSGRQKRIQTESDLQMLNEAIDNGTVSDMLFSVEGQGKQKVVDEFGNVSFVPEQIVDSDRWTNVINSMSSKEAKDAIDKLLNGEEQTDADKEAIKNASAFYNATTADNTYQLGNAYTESILGNNAIDRMSLGEFDQSEFGKDIFQDEYLRDYFNQFEHGAEVMAHWGEETEAQRENLKMLGNEMRSKATSEMKKYGNQTDKVADITKRLNGTLDDQIGVMKEVNNQAEQISTNQYYRDQWRKGDKSAETLNYVSGVTGIGTRNLKGGNYDKSLVENLLGMDEQRDIQSATTLIQGYTDEFMKVVNTELEKSGMKEIQLSDIIIKDGKVQLPDNFSSLMEGSEAIAAAFQRFADAVSQIRVDGQINFEAVRDAFSAFVTVTGLTGSRGGGGGGGGGGKTATDKLIEKLKNRISDVDHQIKMVQYAETKYQNRGELTNYMNALRTEDIYQADKQSVLEDNIKQMKAHMATLKKDSDEWRKAFEALKGYEEQLASVINTREELDKKLRDTQKQIYKTTTDLEDRLAGFYEAEENKRRSMLAGRVNMEQTVLDVIRKRYQDEWELVEKDIDKKKEALQEEMNLIDERLQRRKDAEDEAEKYEELAEYQRQLALIQTDPTRSKDAAELRKKIADLQKDISWDIADKQAQNAKDDLQDQMDAYDKFKTRGSEDLQKFLEDANNLAGELEKIMSGTQEDIIKWLQANSVEYKNSTTAMKQQMTDTWTDTYKDMMHITTTYWAQVKAIMAGDYQGALQQLKNSDEYKNATKEGRQAMEMELEDLWNNWIKAHKNDRNNDQHDDDDVKKKGKTNTTNTNPGGKNDDTNSILKKHLGDDFGKRFDDAAKRMKQIGQDIFNSIKDGKGTFGSIISVLKDASNSMKDTSDKLSNIWTGLSGKTKNNQQRNSNETNTESSTAQFGKEMSKTTLKDLENEMEKGWKQFQKSYDKVSVESFWSTIDPSKFSVTNQSIETVNIEINEASLADDADLDEVAKEVGRRFAQELERNGLNTTNYGF